MIAAVVFRTAEGVYSAASDRPGDVVGPFDCQGLAFATFATETEATAWADQLVASFSRTETDDD